MQDKDLSPQVRDIVLNEMPGHYEVPGFMERHEKYLLEARQEDQEQQAFLDKLSPVLKVAGVVLCIIVIPYAPALAVTVGTLIILASQWLGSTGERQYMSREDYLLYKWPFIMPDGSPCERELLIKYAENNEFHIDFAPPPDT